MLRRGLCLLLTAALCLTTGCVADRAAMQAEAEQALLAQQEETLRQEEAERRARQEERRRQAGEVLHAEMEEICRKYQVVGMSLAVFDEEGVFYRQSYGYADVEAGIPAGEDTIYRAASVSKCVTALVALDLASEGKIDPEAPLPRLGRCEVVSRYPDAPITLRHLLTHTAGLADSETYREAVAEKVLPPLGEVLESCYTGAKPGTQYCYTNFGLGLVSGVMEAVTGERFLDYTREQVFEPMGMDAAYSYSQLTHPERVANIYQNGECTVRMVEWTGMSAKYTVLPLGELYALGHGDLFITAEDLARLGAIMAGCPGEGEAVALSEEYRLAMQTPQYERELAEGSYPNELCRGLGTQITDHLLPDRRMVGHQGNAYGSICGLFYDPETRTGFALLTNGALGQRNAAGVFRLNEDTAQAVYAAFFGLEREEPDCDPPALEAAC